MIATRWNPELDLFALLFWSMGTAVLARASWQLRDTTLRAAMFWARLAWCFLAVSLLLPREIHPYIHYSSSVLVVTPVLAALGAKRPQNGAWQSIVLTLAGVLLLPVVQGLAYGDAAPHAHALLRWVVVAHIGLGVGNYVFTRYWFSALLFGYGGARLQGWHHFKAWPDEVGTTVAIALALVCAWLVCRRASRESQGLQRLWLDFRDAYGAVWALRVAERLNAAAKQHGWPVEFTWSGILVVDRAKPSGNEFAKPSEAALDALEPEVRHRVERELRSMLRRFVSHEWIVRRLNT